MSVCGLELGRHHEEQPRLRSHRMSVPMQIEKERAREGKKGNVSNLAHVVCLSVHANEYVVALHHCPPW